MEKVEQTFVSDLNKYEQDHKKKLVHYPPVGRYISNSTDIQEMFTTPNGTAVLIELESLGKTLYDDYPIIQDLTSNAVNKGCSKEEQKAFDGGLVGMAEFLMDVRTSL